jgi:hypothetical protein
LENEMKHQILIPLVGIVIAFICTANAQADNQQDVRCVLGGSAITGMVVHIDPNTGRPTSRPLPDQAADIASSLAARANRSSQGLVEEVGPTGGVRVNLRGRYRSPLVAVADTDGGVHVDHVSCDPAIGLTVSEDQ